MLNGDYPFSQLLADCMAVIQLGTPNDRLHWLLSCCRWFRNGLVLLGPPWIGRLAVSWAGALVYECRRKTRPSVPLCRVIPRS